MQKIYIVFSILLTVAFLLGIYIYTVSKQAVPELVQSEAVIEEQREEAVTLEERLEVFPPMSNDEQLQMLERLEQFEF